MSTPLKDNPAASSVPREVREHLRKNETLLWWGRPAPWRLGVRRLPQGLFGALLLGVLATTTWKVLAHGTPSSSPSPIVAWPLLSWFAFGGLVFLGIALACLAMPFMYAWSARSTCYLITKDRVLIVMPSRFRTTTVIEFRAGEVRRVITLRGSNDIGDVLLWRGTIDFRSISWDPKGSIVGDWRPDAGLLATPDLEHVDALVRAHHLRPE